jgi:UDP-N-acetylglucosamine 2-epimerase
MKEITLALSILSIMLKIMSEAKLILTDSGEIQKEAFWS